MKKMCFLFLFLLSGCSTISYQKTNNTPLKETKKYMTYKQGFTTQKDILDDVITEYSKGGSINYKGKFLGSGKKMLDRIIEIEKELSK